MTTFFGVLLLSMHFLEIYVYSVCWGSLFISKSLLPICLRRVKFFDTYVGRFHTLFDIIIIIFFSAIWYFPHKWKSRFIVDRFGLGEWDGIFLLLYFVFWSVLRYL